MTTAHIRLAMAALLLSFATGGWAGSNFERIDLPGTWIRAVIVEGDRAFIGEAATLTVLDIGDGALPQVTAQLELSGPILRIAKTDGLLIALAEPSLAVVVDIADPDAPRVTAEIKILPYHMDNPPSLDIVASGSLLCVNAWQRMHVYDLADPTNPVRVNTIMNRHAKLLSGSVVATSSHKEGGYRLLDMSDPAAPVELAHIFGWYDTLLGMNLDADVAYTASDGKLHAHDISDLAAPELASSLDLPGAEQLAIAGDRGLVSHGTKVSALDLTDPLNPAITGTYDSPHAPTDLALTADLGLVAMWQPSISIFDLDQLDPPLSQYGESLGSRGRGSRLALHGSLALLSDPRSAPIVVDVADPTEPRVLGEVGANSAQAIAAAATTAYVSDNTLKVVDIADPANPVRIDISLPGSGYFRDMEVAGSLLYAVGGDVSPFRIYDIADPHVPTAVGSWTPGATIRRVEIAGQHAFALSEYRLDIVDVSDPANPTPVGHYAGLLRGRDLALSGSLVCIADRSAGIKLLDASDPASPTLTGHFEQLGAVDALTAGDDGLLFATSLHDSFVYAIDTTDPARPIVRAIRRILRSGDAELATRDDLLFVASGGLEILRYTGEVPTPELDALVVEIDLPPMLATDLSDTVTLTVRNAGSATWSAAAGDALTVTTDTLGLVDPGDARLELPEGLTLEPNESHEFALALHAPSDAATGMLGLRMSRGAIPFGETAEVPIVVEPARLDAGLILALYQPAMAPPMGYDLLIAYQNTGTRTWGAGFGLRVVGDTGHIWDMPADTVPVGAVYRWDNDYTVRPWDHTSFGIMLRDADTPGTHTLTLQMTDEAGQPFGDPMLFEISSQDTSGESNAGDWKVYR